MANIGFNMSSPVSEYFKVDGVKTLHQKISEEATRQDENLKNGRVDPDVERPRPRPRSLHGAYVAPRIAAKSIHELADNLRVPLPAQEMANRIEKVAEQLHRGMPDRMRKSDAVAEMSKIAKSVRMHQVTPKEAVTQLHQIAEAVHPIRVMPARVMPARAMPARAMPTRAMPARAMPARVMPARAMPARAMPARAMPAHARAMPARAMPARAMPARAMPAHVMPAHGRPVPAHAPAHVMPAHVMPAHGRPVPGHIVHKPSPMRAPAMHARANVMPATVAPAHVVHEATEYIKKLAKHSSAMIPAHLAATIEDVAKNHPAVAAHPKFAAAMHHLAVSVAQGKVSPPMATEALHMLASPVRPRPVHIKTNVPDRTPDDFISTMAPAGDEYPSGMEY